MRALRILEERNIEYMVESSMEKALKRTKGTCLQIFRMGSKHVGGIQLETERRLRREFANIDSDVLLVLSVDCCLTGY